MDDLQNIEDYIHLIRGHRVMLDRDIAAFYGVEAKRLNEKVKRNPRRFAGEDFMFQLTQEEYDELRLRSQFATIKKGRGSHHLKTLPLPNAYDELKKEIEKVKDEMNEILADQNDINESTRAQLDAISTALAELQSSRSQIATLKKHRPIGFIQPGDDKDKNSKS